MSDDARDGVPFSAVTASFDNGPWATVGRGEEHVYQAETGERFVLYRHPWCDATHLHFRCESPDPRHYDPEGLCFHSVAFSLANPEIRVIVDRARPLEI